MKRLILAAAIMLGTAGCSLINPEDTWGESGRFWCNDRYREIGYLKLDEFGGKTVVDGYMYALASALSLQRAGDKVSEAHWFEQPSRILETLDPPLETTGFDRQTFLWHREDGDEVVIIAFSGSNDWWNDWFLTNFLGSMEQHTQAREYVSAMLKDERIKGKKVVLVGTSLGGALAIYAGQNPLHSRYISEIWTFNPSPRTFFYDGDKDRREANRKKTRLIASKDEALSGPRTWKFLKIFSGVQSIEVADGNELVLGDLESGSIYAHYRWGVARQVLWSADGVLSDEGRNRKWTIPLAILSESRFKSCQKWQDQATENDREKIRKLMPLDAKPQVF